MDFTVLMELGTEPGMEPVAEPAPSAAPSLAPYPAPYPALASFGFYAYSFKKIQFQHSTSGFYCTYGSGYGAGYGAGGRVGSTLGSILGSIPGSLPTSVLGSGTESILWFLCLQLPKTIQWQHSTVQYMLFLWAFTSASHSMQWANFILQTL
jgi:hypothetical protein